MSYYDDFKYYQKKADEMRAKQNSLNSVKEKYGAGWPVTDLDYGMHEKLTQIVVNMENGNYGWSGDDADACREKLKELQNDVWSAWMQLIAACEDLVSVIEEERRQYADKVMQSMNNFNELDWAQCTLDYGWTSVKDWWNSMF